MSTVGYPLTPERIERFRERFDTIVTKEPFLKEARRARNTTGNPRRSWVLAHDHISLTDVNTLIAFFEARKGRWDRFQFTDPADSVTYNVRFDADVMKIDKPLGRETNPRFSVVVELREVL